MKLWEKTKDWFKRHKTGVKYTLIGVGSFAGGLMVMHKIDCITVDKALEMLPGEIDKELAKMSDVKELSETDQDIEDKTAWNKDWDEYGCELEFTTRQPHGPYRDGDFVDILEGNCFIVAGPNSLYNDNPDSIEFYALDKDGWYHKMPDDVHYA